MKNVLFIRGMALWLVLIFALAACNKEEDTPPDQQKLLFSSEEVMVLLPDGLKNSDDTNAKTCVGFIESALDMTSFMDNMEVPDNAQKSDFKGTGDSWQWTWKYSGETMTFYWTYDESGGKRYWTMDISYNNSPRYSYIDAWETLDGSQGEVVWNFAWAAILNDADYDEEDFLFWKYTWNKDASGGYQINFYWDGDGVDYDYIINYSVDINADGSGSLDQYSADQLVYHMEWDALGNGIWSNFYGGEEYGSGSWSAG